MVVGINAQILALLLDDTAALAQVAVPRTFVIPAHLAAFAGLPSSASSINGIPTAAQYARTVPTGSSNRSSESITGGAVVERRGQAVEQLALLFEPGLFQGEIRPVDKHRRQHLGWVADQEAMLEVREKRIVRQVRYIVGELLDEHTRVSRRGALASPTHRLSKDRRAAAACVGLGARRSSP